MRLHRYDITSYPCPREEGKKGAIVYGTPDFLEVIGACACIGTRPFLLPLEGPGAVTCLYCQHGSSETEYYDYVFNRVLQVILYNIIYLNTPGPCLLRDLLVQAY